MSGAKKKNTLIPTSTLFGPGFKISPDTLRNLDQLDSHKVFEKIEQAQSEDVDVEETGNDSFSEDSSTSLPGGSLDSNLGAVGELEDDELTARAKIFSLEPKSRLPIKHSVRGPNRFSINLRSLCNQDQLEDIKNSIHEYVKELSAAYHVNIPLPHVYGKIGDCKTVGLMAEMLNDNQPSTSTSKPTVHLTREQGTSAHTVQRDICTNPMVEILPTQKTLERSKIVQQLIRGIRLNPITSKAKPIIINTSSKGFTLSDLELMFKDRTLPDKMSSLIVLIFKSLNNFNQMAQTYNLIDIHYL